jgi:hypothetical protein
LSKRVSERSGEQAALEQRAARRALREWRDDAPSGGTASATAHATINDKENGEP